MTLTEFQRISYKLLGRIVRRRMDTNKIKQDIKEARLGIRAEAYLATAALTSILITGGLLLLSGLALFILPVFGIVLPFIAYPLLVGVPPMLGAITFVVLQSTPGSRAKSRAKDIDLRIPYALNYVAAMASAGVNVDEIFKALAEQGEVYGECSREAEAIYRDIAYFGKDSVTALKRAIDRTPSTKWSDFLQGSITTVTSGGDLKKYFQNKAERYMWENRQDQKQFVEMMGLMAETYVTAAVAGPLFLIVMMAIMGMLGGEGPSQLYLIIYLLLPIVNIGFAFGLQAMTPEV